jgi:hypothetical protein
MLDKLYAALKRIVNLLPLPWLRPGKMNASAQYLREEKLRARLIGGDHQIRLLPILDSYTEETEEMRRVYRVMLRSPVVKAAVLTKILAVASLDIQVHPASDRLIDREAADFVRDSLNRARGGTRALAMSILMGGLIDGFSVCEKRWMVVEHGRWKGKWALRDLKAKDTEHLWLVGDEFRNVVQVEDRRTARRYAPSNFVVWSHLPPYSAPTGMSDLRAAYRAFWLEDSAWQLRGTSLERYTLPMVLGKYKVNDVKEELDQQLAQVRSQTWLTIPESAQVDVIQLAAANQSDFAAAIRDLREDVALAITGATLQMLQGQVADGRGDSQVHKQTSQLLQWYLAAEVGSALSDQVAPEMVAWNFSGAQSPQVTLGGVDDSTMAASLAIDEGLLRMQVPLSLEEIYKRYGRGKPLNEADALRPPPPPGAGVLGVGGETGGPSEFADDGTPLAGPQPQGQDQAAAEAQQAKADTSTSSAVADLQKSYTKGDISREAALANAQLTLGIDPAQAEALFPKPGGRVATEAGGGPVLDAADSGVSILTAATKPLSPMPREGRRPPSGIKAADGQAAGTVAGPEADARKAEELLRAAERRGSAVLARVARAAVERLVAGGPQAHHFAGSFFSAGERDELARALASATATANLLGRSRTRIRAERAKDRGRPAKFSDEPTDLSRFAEGIAPLSPLRAVLWFRRLVPGLAVRPADFAARHLDQGFRLAATTEKVLLARVKDVIDRVLAAGRTQDRQGRPPGEQIDLILQRAGVAPQQPGYGDLVFRTNAMSALNRGTMEEMQDPEVGDVFPAWRYAAIPDGRARPHHVAKNGNLYPSDVDFEDVRGRDIADVANCRCVPVPVSKYELAELRGERGVRVFAEVPPAPAAQLAVVAPAPPANLIPLPDVRQDRDYDCGAGLLRSTFQHFGVNMTQDAVIREAGTDPVAGTPPQKMVEELRWRGLKAEDRTNLTDDDLKAHLDAGRPVLCCVQEGSEPWNSLEQNGHWVGAVGHDPACVWVQDPLAGLRAIPWAEWDQNWHDRAADGTRYVRYGIAVSR